MDLNEAFVAEARDFLRHVDARELHRRIARFRMLNFGAMSYAELTNAIIGVIQFDTPTGPRAILRPTIGWFAAGTRFYRVRTIPSEDRDSIGPPSPSMSRIRAMSRIRDCWEPPKEVVPVGRLNRAGQPLLYTSPRNFLVAIDEMKIEDGECCSLIVYEAADNVKIAVIGNSHPSIGALDEYSTMKMEMIDGFLRDEFTRDVGPGTEYLYRLSEVIAKSWFDLPPEVQDAWCYPSIVDKNSCNVAFRPDRRREKLRLIGVQIGSPRTLSNGQRYLHVELLAGEKEGTEELDYFRMGSLEQRRLFPELG